MAEQAGGLAHDEGWTYLETVEVPPGGSSTEVRSAFLARHPELADIGELRVDLQCGRDGRARLSFWAPHTRDTGQRRRASTTSQNSDPATE